jgi:hypothetical protein
MKKIFIVALVSLLFFACKKDNSTKAPPTPPVGTTFTFIAATINNSVYNNALLHNVPLNPVIKLTFSAPIDTSTILANIVLTGSSVVAFKYSYSNTNDSSLIIQPSAALQPLTNYTLSVYSNLKSTADSTITKNVYINFITAIDSMDKFPQIPDTALLTLIEQQTFEYFWNNANPTSGMARERNSDATTDATGGTGFGVMAILAGVQRNFISRQDALTRITTLVNFLSDTTKVKRYHGAFSHWINGATGATIPFGTQDNGGDIVETSYMLEGLLCARQYFNSTADPNEINLRNNINAIYNGVNWNWYRQNNANVLTWNWSPNFGFAINVQVQGWDEALITYVLAASSPDSSIPKIVYDNGWARNGGMKNGNSYYGYTLPLGSDKGGPLFFEHYSFMGINPNGLSDAYAKYDTQTVNHSKINYSYCVANPHNYYGYSNQCWGLTASDAPPPIGYNANEPDNDIGVISPTAAISSLPYTPVESMQALRFFYYKLGDKLWGQYGFRDAFDLSTGWFDNDFLAIDQGPEIVMIENYRSNLLWNLFTSCPEVKTGMLNLGFTAPYL